MMTLGFKGLKYYSTQTYVTENNTGMADAHVIVTLSIWTVYKTCTCNLQITDADPNPKSNPNRSQIAQSILQIDKLCATIL